MVWNRPTTKSQWSKTQWLRMKLRAHFTSSNEFALWARCSAAKINTKPASIELVYRLTVILFHLFHLFIHKLRDWGHTQHSDEEKKKHIRLYRHKMNCVWTGRCVCVCARALGHEAIAKVVRSRESSKWQLYKLTVGMQCNAVAVTLRIELNRKNVMRCTINWVTAMRTNDTETKNRSACIKLKQKKNR